MKTIQLKQIPNVISVFRLAAIPFLPLLLWSGANLAFAILYLCLLLTDVLDGYLARKWNCCTPLGTMLDSIADLCLIVVSFTLLIIFFPVFFQAHFSSLFVFMAWYAFNNVYMLVKYKKLAGFHLYSFKMTAYFQGLFFVIFFFGCTISIFYYLMLIAGFYALAEELILIWLMEEPQQNCKSLWNYLSLQ